MRGRLSYDQAIIDSFIAADKERYILSRKERARRGAGDCGSRDAWKSSANQRFVPWSNRADKLKSKRDNRDVVVPAIPTPYFPD
jgi:hypothetical protein